MKKLIIAVCAVGFFLGSCGNNDTAKEIAVEAEVTKLDSVSEVLETIEVEIGKQTEALEDALENLEY